MKKIIYILAIIALVFGACDKIEEPYLEETGGSGPTPGENVKKILLEEYTGHLCVNCPEATKLANDLKQIYGEQLVLVSIHAGELSLPSGDPFQADYRTDAGTAIYNNYQPIGVPTGMVNRQSFDGGVVLFKDSWEPAIQELLELPAEVHIEIEPTYNEGTRKLGIHVHAEFLQDLDKTVNLSVFIIESGIVSAQKNDASNIGPTPDWLNYEHKHLLRTAVNGTWGELLTDQPVSGAEMTKDLSITLDAEWDVDHCEIIAILLDADTYEVIQVEEAAVL